MFRCCTRVLLSPLIVAIIGFGLTLPVLASAVSWSANVYISNNTTSAYTNLPYGLTVNNTYLAANGYMGAQGLDTRVLQGTTQLPWLVCDNKTMTVLPSLPAAGQLSLQYTTGNSDTTAFSFIAGQGGYVTVNDTASMEPSSNFTLDIDGYVDPSVSVNVVGKSGALNLATGSGNVTFVVPGGSTYPIISSNSTGHSNIGVSGVGVTMPAGVANNGLLIVMITTSNGTSTIGTPTGWVQLYQTNGFAASGYSCYGAYKVTTGTETTTNFTTSNMPCNDWQCVYIAANSYFGVPIVGTTATGNSANPDPPSVSTGVSSPTLFIAVEHNGSTATASSAPTSYLYLQNSTETSAGSNTGIATRYLSASSDDPGTFTIGAGVNWASQTIALLGAGSTLSSTVASGAHDIQLTMYKNEVANGSMEAGTANWSTNSRSTISANTTVVAQGTYSLAVEANDPAAGGISSVYQNIPFNTAWRGLPAVLACYVNVPASNPRTQRVRFSDGVNLYESPNLTKDGTYHWIQLPFTFVSTASGAQVSITVKQESVVDTTSYMYVDAVMLVVGVTSIPDFNTLRMYVAGVDVAHAYTETAISDTPSNWTIGGLSTPYINSFKEYVGGNLKCWYQPNTVILGTALPDRSGTGNTGTITWGTNTAQVNQSWSSFVASAGAVAGSLTTTTPETLPATPNHSWFGQPDLTKLATNPVRPLVMIWVDNSNMPEAQAWQWLGLAFVLFCTMATAVGLRGHLLIAGITSGGSIGLLVAFTIWPFWSLVFAVMAIVAGVIAERLPWV